MSDLSSYRPPSPSSFGIPTSSIHSEIIEAGVVHQTCPLALVLECTSRYCDEVVLAICFVLHSLLDMLVSFAF